MLYIIQYQTSFQLNPRSYDEELKLVFNIKNVQYKLHNFVYHLGRLNCFFFFFVWSAVTLRRAKIVAAQLVKKMYVDGQRGK